MCVHTQQNHFFGQRSQNSANKTSRALFFPLNRRYQIGLGTVSLDFVCFRAFVDLRTPQPTSPSGHVLSWCVCLRCDRFIDGTNWCEDCGHDGFQFTMAGIEFGLALLFQIRTQLEHLCLNRTPFVLRVRLSHA